MPFTFPNSFADAAVIQADDFNENFEAIGGWIDSEAIVSDASVPFVNVPSGPAEDPTTDNQLSRKAYVDDKAGGSKASYIRTKDSGGAQATLKTAVAINNNTDAISDLTVSVVEETDHWYRSTLVIPEIWMNANEAPGFGIYPKLAAVLKRNSVEIARQWVTNIIDTSGVGICLVSRPRLCTAGATIDWEVFLRNGTNATISFQYKADSNYPMYHYVEDMGTGL